MTTSEQLNELATALAKAQAEMEGAVKASINPFFAKPGDARKGAYADLSSVRDACFPALTKYGIAVVQSPTADGAKVSVETLLLHTSGQWIRDTLTVTAKDDSPQAIGSATTYCRRYSLQAFAGIAPEDDDGNAAQPHGQTAKPVAVPTIPKGFDDWLIDLGAVADEGIVKFRQAWKDAKPDYRDYLMKMQPKSLDALADKAKGVTAAKSNAVSA